jgi:hypothetical protein
MHSTGGANDQCLRIITIIIIIIIIITITIIISTTIIIIQMGNLEMVRILRTLANGI